MPSGSFQVDDLDASLDVMTSRCPSISGRRKELYGLTHIDPVDLFCRLRQTVWRNPPLRSHAFPGYAYPLHYAADLRMLAAFRI